MLDWIKKALGSFGEIQNKNGYGQEILEPLAQDLARTTGKVPYLQGRYWHCVSSVIVSDQEQFPVTVNSRVWASLS
jgi:hypothetical protein